MHAGAGIPLMAAGGGAGVVTVWDLEARKLHTVIRDAHDAPVTKLHFFPGEPRLMSAGAVSAFHLPCLGLHAAHLPLWSYAMHLITFQLLVLD